MTIKRLWNGALWRVPHAWWLRREWLLAAGEFQIDEPMRDEPSVPRVYFPYDIRHIHNVWKPYVTNPPVTYHPYLQAELCQFINYAPKGPYLSFNIGHAGAIREIRVPGGPKPFVVDAEHILALTGDISNWQRALNSVGDLNKLLSQDACRKVWVGSKGLMEHGKKYVHPDLHHKLDYAYVTFPAQPDYQYPEIRDPDGPFTILSIASRFWDKGVPQALEAFKIFRARHGKKVRMILVCNAVPKHYEVPEGVEHFDMPMMSPEFKEQVFQSAHVLVIPALSDSGGPFLEAAAWGVPAITTRITHGDEAVQDAVTGYLLEAPFYAYSDDYGIRWKSWPEFVEFCEREALENRMQPLVESTLDALERLYANPEICSQMRFAQRQAHTERFSIQVRNRKLRQIYRDALIN